MSDKDFFDLTFKINRIPLLATANFFEAQLEKTPPENVQFLETLLKPADQLDSMGKFLSNICFTLFIIL